MLCAAALALGALGAAGCGDSSDSEGERTSAGSTNGSESSTTKDAKSGDATSKSDKPGITFGQKSATGESALAQAQGTIDNPEIVRLRVVADPPQNASVSYTLICVVNGKAGGDSGQFSASTPIDREIKIPGGKPSDCNVSANAQLEVGRSGKVTMKLRGRER